MRNKAAKLFWVVLVASSSFVLGYTLKPKPSRMGMMPGRRGIMRAPALPRGLSHPHGR